MAKYNPQFERDYTFYYSHRQVFTFTGSNIKTSYGIQFAGEPNQKGADDKGKEIEVPWPFFYSEAGNTAKECFYRLDSRGEKFPCAEPELLVEILSCKAAINLQIKLWAQGRAEYTLSLVELQGWLGQYQCPEWVLKAVESQKEKILQGWCENKFEQHPFYFGAFELHMAECLLIEKDKKIEKLKHLLQVVQKNSK